MVIYIFQEESYIYNFEGKTLCWGLYYNNVQKNINFNHIYLKSSKSETVHVTLIGLGTFFVKISICILEISVWVEEFSSNYIYSFFHSECYAIDLDSE